MITEFGYIQYWIATLYRHGLKIIFNIQNFVTAKIRVEKVEMKSTDFKELPYRSSG